MANNIKLVKAPITLDRERTLLFNLNAFCDLEDVFGTVDDAMKALQDGKVKALRALLWAGLKHEDPGLTEEAVGAMLGLGDLQEISEAINKAIISAMPEIDPNSQTPEK